MTNFTVSPLIAAAIVVFAGGVFAGRASLADEIRELRLQSTAGSLVAQLQTDSLHAVTGVLTRERAVRDQVRLAGEKELASRGVRHTTIDAAAKKRTAVLRKQVTDHDDCRPLRELPVCDSVADRLFGVDAAGAN
ncbi:hypothetical protein [Lysobacter sp. CA199]|uniref:hypothetical protein n=1 Tax=Lysobacter sp. CA199 TaxID=3455608 RepID=UPI003F8D22E2